MPPVENNPLHAVFCRDVELLEFLGMDQNSIAREANMSPALLSMILNGTRRVTLRRLHALTDLTARVRDTAIRHNSETIAAAKALPPSGQRDQIFWQCHAFLTGLFRQQYRATDAFRRFIEQEVDKIRHGINMVGIVVDALTVKGKLDQSELVAGQEGAVALRDALQELAKYHDIIERGNDELAWLQDQLQKFQEISGCQPELLAASCSVTSPSM